MNRESSMCIHTGRPKKWDHAFVYYLFIHIFSNSIAVQVCKIFCVKQPGFIINTTLSLKLLCGWFKNKIFLQSRSQRHYWLFCWIEWPRFLGPHQQQPLNPGLLACYCHASFTWLFWSIWPFPWAIQCVLSYIGLCNGVVASKLAVKVTAFVARVNMDFKCFSLNTFTGIRILAVS